MCKNCYSINDLFVTASQNPHESYYGVIDKLSQLEKRNEIVLIAGDCNLNEVADHLAQELHYTVCHYFQCKTCEQYIFVGACIRGTPIFKFVESLKDENLDNKIWGKVGKYFDHLQ